MPYVMNQMLAHVPYIVPFFMRWLSAGTRHELVSFKYKLHLRDNFKKHFLSTCTWVALTEGAVRAERPSG